MPWRLTIIALGLAYSLHSLGVAQESLTAEEAVKLFEQAKKLRAAREYDKALPLYERVAKAAPALWGEDSTHHATILNDLAGLHRDMGRYVKAEPCTCAP